MIYLELEEVELTEKGKCENIFRKFNPLNFDGLGME